MLDPQVQIHIIELAWKFAENPSNRQGSLAGKSILEAFDHAIQVYAQNSSP